MTLMGAAVTLKTGQGWVDAIVEFETITGHRPMQVRRCYDGAPVADLASSNARHDLNARASLLSIKPTMTTSLATMESLAASIVEAGHPTDVIIYHEPVDNMTGSAFKSLYLRSAAPFREAGIPTGVCYTNWSCNLPWSDPQSALKNYWPGDDEVDFIGIDEYPVGEVTSTKTPTPMTERAWKVSQFADARGIPLGLAEFGVDKAWDLAKSETWLRSVTEWANDRQAQGRPLRWLCYFSSSDAVKGWDYWLSNKVEYVQAYKEMAAIHG